MNTIVRFPSKELLRDSMIPKNFSHLFDSIFTDENVEQHSFFTPRVDIVEKEKEFQLHVSLPGMKRDEIKVEVKNSNLLISGERKMKKEEKENRYHLVESRYGAFSRTFSLPENVKVAEIDAKFEDGILNISIPKGDAMLPTSIEVK